jgi:hypothetical protein
MEFEHIPVRVSDENGRRAIWESDRAAAEGDPRIRQGGLHGVEIADRQGDMGKTRVLLRPIHQDIWGSRIRRIENKIDHDPGRVRQDGDGLRSPITKWKPVFRKPGWPHTAAKPRDAASSRANRAGSARQAASWVSSHWV